MRSEPALFADVRPCLPLFSSLSVFLGFAFFYITEKLSRTFGGDEEHGHSHSHSHSSAPAEAVVSPSAQASATTAKDAGGLRQRNLDKKKINKGDVTGPQDIISSSASSSSVGPSKLSAYLNLSVMLYWPLLGPTLTLATISEWETSCITCGLDLCKS